MAGQLDEKGGGIQKCKWPVLETVWGRKVQHRGL